MPDLRKDPIVGRWVIIASARAKRPHDFDSTPQRQKGRFCPFCEGNEDKTPGEIIVQLVLVVDVVRMQHPGVAHDLRDFLLVSDNRMERDVVLKQKLEEIASDLRRVVLCMEHDRSSAFGRIQRWHASKVGVR